MNQRKRNLSIFPYVRVSMYAFLCIENHIVGNTINVYVSPAVRSSLLICIYCWYGDLAVFSSSVCFYVISLRLCIGVHGELFFTSSFNLSCIWQPWTKHATKQFPFEYNCKCRVTVAERRNRYFLHLGYRKLLRSLNAIKAVSCFTITLEMFSLILR